MWPCVNYDGVRWIRMKRMVKNGFEFEGRPTILEAPPSKTVRGGKGEQECSKLQLADME